MNGRFRPRGAALGALLFAVAVAASAGAAAQGTVPAAGRFLVAARSQQGFFAHSVILLVDYGPRGAFGLVINHPTTLPLANLLPDERELEGHNDTVYLGGPVSLDRLTLLIRSHQPPPRALHVTDDIYASGSLTVLRKAVNGELAGAVFRGYAGYAGWGPGQLDAEIARGDWKVIPAQADSVFSDHPQTLWRKLVQSQELKVVRLGRTPFPFRQSP